MKLISTIAFSFFSLVTWAQKFTINEVDASTFPNVSFTINSKQAIEKNNVSITDNNQAITTFQWVLATNNITTVSTKQATCFLIEASAFVSNYQMAFIKKAIKSHLLQQGNSTETNICFYLRSNSVEMLKRLSTEFTVDYNMLSRDMESKIYVTADKLPEVDFYKVVYECINFMGNKTALPSTKKIVVIATGNNNGSSAFSISECVEKAKQKGIVLDAIGLSSNTQNAIDNCKLLAEKTGGNFCYAKNENDINLFFQQYKAVAAKTNENTDSSYNYNVTYKSLASESIDSINTKVDIGSVSENFTYTPTSSNITTNGKSNNKLFLIAGAGLLLMILGIVFFVNKSKKKKAAQAFALKQQLIAATQAQQQQEARASEARAQAANAVKPAAPSASHATKATQIYTQEQQNNKTQIAGVKIPTITVYVNSLPNFYEIKNAAYSIGRNTNNDIVISDSTVSVNHGSISIENGQVFLTDHNSTNGSFVNNKKIQKQQLHSGDTITLGKIEIKYHY